MKRLIVLFLSILLFSTLSFSQKTFVTGTIKDTLENKDLSNAVISLLRPSDSVLVKYTRSDNAGHFKLQNIIPAKYIVLITYPRFADFADVYDVKEPGGLDLGTIALTSKATLLQEVVIRSGAAIRIKGDTTEFVADSFKVKEGATVEDLLKQLPGLQVNSKSEITAQGKQVNKVLVDGEEFFGDDPTMATQNINAKAVSKVQVYDTKSEQQQLTGLTTGNEGKTVNIQLKEDAKKGAFGKAYVNTDFHKYEDSKLMFNKFVGKKKVAAYASMTNINTGSLSWQDRNKLGIEDDWQYDEIGDYYISFGSNDEFNDWSLRGLPKAYTAGALFSNKWNADKNNVNASYRFNSLGTNNVGSTFTQNILPTGITYSNKRVNTRGLSEQHAINGKYEWKIDSLASLKFTTASTYKTTETFGTTASEYLDSIQQFINRSLRTNDNNTKRLQSDNQLTYRQMFNKKDRLLIASVRYGITNDDGEGILNTKIDYYKNGSVDSVAIIDQKKINDGRSETIGTKLTFNEPLSAKWNLVLDYSYNHNNSLSKTNTFEKDLNNKYADLNEEFSNNFDLNATSNSGTSTLRYIGKKVKLAIGSGLSNVKLRLHNLDSNSFKSYNFLNITPQAQFNYNIKQQTGINFNYRGVTRQPTINQLQPLRDNNDPLNVFTGNPDLKVGFDHNFNLSFNQYKVLSAKGMWFNVSYTIQQNAITNRSVIDDNGKRTYFPVNVNGNHRWYFWGNWNKGNGQKTPRFGFQLNGNGGRSITYVNNATSINKYTSLATSFTIGMETPDKFRFNLRPSVGYNKSSSSLQKTIDNNYFTYGGNVDGYIMLPGKFELSSNVNFDLRQRIEAFSQNTNLILWNAELNRKIFKDKSGRIGIIANDILDQNKGFNRIINSNFVTDESYQRISRYFLIRLEWSFNKMPGGEKK
jgi:hypothetical protein